MALFETLYERGCKSLVGWFEPGETKLLRPNLIIDAMEKVQIIHDRIKATYDRQKSYKNKRK